MRYAEMESRVFLLSYIDQISTGHVISIGEPCTFVRMVDVSAGLWSLDESQEITTLDM